VRTVRLSHACFIVAIVALTQSLRADQLRISVDEGSASVAAQHHTEPDTSTQWQPSVDGVVFAIFNHQGGRRGGSQFVSTNWIMGMLDRPIGTAKLTLTGMFSAEPATVGAAGYDELFQGGEAYRGLQNTDRQHPHDLVMQLSTAIRIPLKEATLTFAGGPVGEPALGPVTFMHRPSSWDNPLAPLSHHIFDSTHTASTVFLGRVDGGPVAIEGSIFHGREPDEDRYDIDLAPPDSWSARAWWRITPGWTVQGSHGFLRQPEQLEPGDQRRSNVSLSWLGERDPDFAAVLIAYGRNARTYSTVTAWLAEASMHRKRLTMFGRFERTTLETEILLFPTIVHRPHPGELVDPVRALTVGAVRDLATFRGLSLGIGGDATFYTPPALLQVTHGERPASFQLFVRIARANIAGRMWNQTMGSTSHRHR
jgi:hypothetical protein